MSSISDCLAAVDTALASVSELDFDGLGVREQFTALERLETLLRRGRAASCTIAAAVQRRGDEALGGVAHKVIADVLRITPSEAGRRLRDAAQLVDRTTLTGQQLPPELPATAAAWQAGQLDLEHLRAIQKFFRQLPETVPPAAVEKAEAFLAEKAVELRPDQVEVLAAKLAVTLNPDGRFSDEFRSRQRGFAWCGRQRPDGMSVGRLVASPELRAMLDAWLAKFAAPGMCNPEDQSPVVTAEPAPEAADRDTRTYCQRRHDALCALVRGQLGDPTLGKHNGLPVTLVVSATLEQLHSAAGVATTANGSLVPMRDVIRMASHAWHYLAVFDGHSECPLYLGRSKRIATADQRIVLHAKDRGCTAPGCDTPGHLCEVHHVDEWADGGATDIDKLTFACGPHHRLIRPGGWKTRKRRDGSTQWVPPPVLPLKPGRNDFHHPERLLPGSFG